MRQGNDWTQYRSAIHTFSDGRNAKGRASKAATEGAGGQGYRAISTEVAAGEFYFAEDYPSAISRQNPAAIAVWLGNPGVICPYRGAGVAACTGAPCTSPQERKEEVLPLVPSRRGAPKKRFVNHKSVQS